MKSRLMAFTLITASGMFASEANNNSGYSTDNTLNQDCGCCSSCCSSCCTEQKKCIQCTCYVPKFYDLQCNWNVILDAEFLYWYAKETKLSYAIKVEGSQETPNPIFSQGTTARVLAPKERKNFHTKWDPGFRVGTGLSTNCDSWDVYASWTWFRNRKKNSSAVDNYGSSTIGAFFYPLLGQFALINPWTNASVFPGDPNVAFLLQSFDTVAAKWSLLFNSIDLELGRKYWLSRCFAVRPYLGLRGAWTKTHFQTRSSRSFISSGAANNFIMKDHFTNRYWGVGLLGGFQPTWYLFRCFALYGNIDGSLIWGKEKAKKLEKYSYTIGTVTTLQFKNHLKDQLSRMQSIFDLGIGLRWENAWCCNRFLTTLDVGWEHHIWFGVNNRLQTEDAFFLTEAFDPPTIKEFRTFNDIQGNVVFGGLVARLRVDF